jgi:MSHA biogenesis protein MshQ
LHYQLSNSDNFFYDRSVNALVAPFSADIDFSIASITDSDNVNVITTADASPVGVEIRFGRLSLVNSFGPETANLNQLINSEHFDGTTFITTTDNNCVTYNADKISLSNISLDPALTRAEGQGVFMTGKARDIKLTAPGSGKQGEIGVLYDSYDWLKYDWDNDGEYDDNPTAVATFGVFRGNDRVISWREVIN